MSETTWKCYACGEGVPDHFELGSPDSWHMRDTTPGAASGSTMRPLHDRCSSNKEQLSADSDFEAWWQALDWRARAQPNELTVKAAWEESKRLRDERIAELTEDVADVARQNADLIRSGAAKSRRIAELERIVSAAKALWAGRANIDGLDRFSWRQPYARRELWNALGIALSSHCPEPDTKGAE